MDSKSLLMPFWIHERCMRHVSLCIHIGQVVLFSRSPLGFVERSSHRSEWHGLGFDGICDNLLIYLFC